MKNKRKPSRLSKAILEMVSDQQRLGIMGEGDVRKITIRHLGKPVLQTAQPLTGKEIKSIRERAHLSQAAFAHCLNLTVGYVSQLERGVKQPKGPALILLHVMRRKGFEIIL